MSDIVFSCIIPAKDKDDPKLADLIESIRSQDFPQDKIEILVMGTEYGDSEQAKAEGIRQARGEICAMFCADNKLLDDTLFSRAYKQFNLKDFKGGPRGTYEEHYAYVKKDNSLNRYFSLMGCNDPIPFYLGKCDKNPWWKWGDHIGTYQSTKGLSYGDNGFFMLKKWYEKSDLNHFYPMDAIEDVRPFFRTMNTATVWHCTTDGNLLTFLLKRYRYARDLYCDRQDRRWKMLETRSDYWRLLGFILFTITFIPSLCLSIRGWSRIRDSAWFWHWPVCFGFLITYGLLVCRNLLHGFVFQRHVQTA